MRKRKDNNILKPEIHGRKHFLRPSLFFSWISWSSNVWFSTEYQLNSQLNWLNFWYSNISNFLDFKAFFHTILLHLWTVKLSKNEDFFKFKIKVCFSATAVWTIWSINPTKWSMNYWKYMYLDCLFDVIGIFPLHRKK